MLRKTDGRLAFAEMGEQTLRNNQLLGRFFIRARQFFHPLQARFQSLEIGQHQFGFNHINIAHRID